MASYSLSKILTVVNLFALISGAPTDGDTISTQLDKRANGNTVDESSLICFNNVNGNFVVAQATSANLQLLAGGHDSIELDHHRFTSFITVGTAQICLTNHFLFENTHFDPFVLGEAARGITQDCCSHSGSSTDTW